MQHKEYWLILLPDPESLIKAVDAMLLSGWQCQGGLVVTPDCKFAQALVR
jgi:hypothetical protein